jgi:excisionase family DNA binding protein
MESKALLTIDEAAQRLGIGRSHAYIYVMKGEIESVKLGRSRRVPASAIEDFIRRLREDAAV